MTSTFAETANLRIRGLQESDTDNLVALISDPRTMRGNPAYVVPAGEVDTKKKIPEIPGRSLLFCILEAKIQPEDGHNLVGFVSLSTHYAPKNRNAMFGIVLDARHWGKGYGTSFNSLAVE
jgi:RimJ/RimL family protein N-acetyltransferase